MADTIVTALEVGTTKLATMWSPPLIVPLPRYGHHGRQCTCSKYIQAHDAWFELRSYPYDVVTDEGDEQGQNCQQLYSRLKGAQSSSWVCPDRLLKILYDPRWKGLCRATGESPWLTMVLPTVTAPPVENA